MPITQTSIAVGTALVQIVAPDVMPVRAVLHNREDVAGRKIYIGGADLVAPNSVEINSAVVLQITLDPEDALYARTASGTYNLGVIIQKQD
jgi:hypothetical protein